MSSDPLTPKDILNYIVSHKKLGGWAGIWKLEFASCFFSLNTANKAQNLDLGTALGPQLLLWAVILSAGV